MKVCCLMNMIVDKVVYSFGSLRQLTIIFIRSEHYTKMGKVRDSIVYRMETLIPGSLVRMPKHPSSPHLYHSAWVAVQSLIMSKPAAPVIRTNFVQH